MTASSGNSLLFKEEGSFAAELHYDASLFRAEDIRRLNEQFHTVMESALSNPETAIGELEILSGLQLRQLGVRSSTVPRPIIPTQARPPTITKSKWNVPRTTLR